MTDKILNIRFGEWHFQVLLFSDWGFRWPFRISRNPYQAWARTQPGWRWFEWY